MVEYIYRAVDSSGQAADGVMIADSEQQLDKRLQELGYWVIDVNEKSKAKRALGKAVSRRELIDFFNGLHSMLSAGLTVSDSINAIAEETVDERFAAVLRDLKIKVEGGTSVDESLSHYPKVFSPQIINLIRAGEFSGNLAAVCEDVSHHLEWVDKIVADVKQASIYPVMILTAVMGLVFLMFSFVVPRFSKIFNSLELELPLLTQIVVKIGEFSLQYWWLILMVPVCVVLFFKFAPSYSSAVGLQLDRLKLDLPVFGRLNRMIVLSRFCHNMALLTKAGVTILEALSLCKGLVGNRVMERAVIDAELFVNDGKKMTDAFRLHDIISPTVLRMMVVGEESGRLDNALENASSRFDREIPRQIKKVFSILEPMIMITLIMIVGLIGGAVFLPMFSLMSGIGG